MDATRIADIEDARRLQLLIDGAIDYAIYSISLGGSVVSWNSGARRLKGYEAHEIIGQPYATFFTPEDQAQDVPPLSSGNCLARGRAVAFERAGDREQRCAVHKASPF